MLEDAMLAPAGGYAEGGRETGLRGWLAGSGQSLWVTAQESACSARGEYTVQ